MAITLKIYHNEDGNEPFTKWLENIEDSRTDAKIRQRLSTIETGGDLNNFRGLGDYKKLRGVKDLYEFQIRGKGPGYRIYWGRIGRDDLLLLRGGIKRTQKQDIRDAKADWAEHRQIGSEPFDYRDFT